MRYTVVIIRNADRAIVGQHEAEDFVVLCSREEALLGNENLSCGLMSTAHPEVMERLLVSSAREVREHKDHLVKQHEAQVRSSLRAADAEDVTEPAASVIASSPTLRGLVR